MSRKANTETEKKRPIAGYLAAALIPLLLLLGFYLLSGNPSLMERINSGFSIPVLRFMGRNLSRVRFSFMELDIALALLAAAVFLVSLIIRLIRGPKPKIMIPVRHLLVLVAVVSWIWNGYCWFWNSGYYGRSFSQKAGLKTEGLTVEELTDAANFFLEKTNELSAQVPRDKNGLCSCSFEELLTEAETLYGPLEEEFPFLKGEQTVPKAVFYSKIMSMTGFTGVYFPFSGETYINVHQPDWAIPQTISHELSHQRGVHLEAESNFCGIAACIQSDDVLYQYSGYMSGLIHLSNALYTADRDAWKALRENFSEELTADWNENNRYWSEMEGTVTKVTDKVYDAFLRINTQPAGLKSYGMCVDTLVLWLNTSEYSTKLK